jgi:hypothetical protein
VAGEGAEACHGGMAAEPGPTGPIKLTDIQLRLIPELLSYREGAYGFRGGGVDMCPRGNSALGGVQRLVSQGACLAPLEALALDTAAARRTRGPAR